MSSYSDISRTIVPDLFKTTESEPDQNGIITITEFGINEKNKIIKITRKVKRTIQMVKISKGVLERQKWKKFGDCEGFPEGPEKNITTRLTEMNIDLSLDKENKNDENDIEVPTVKCKNCGQPGHFSMKCPKRLDIDPFSKSSASTGKYIPVHRRTENLKPLEEEVVPGLKVFNISEELTERDLRDLFSRFGPIGKISVPKNYPEGWDYLAEKEKNYSSLKNRGFAFVNFKRKQDAELAMQKLEKHKFDNMILHIEWAKVEDKNETRKVVKEVVSDEEKTRINENKDKKMFSGSLYEDIDLRTYGYWGSNKLHQGGYCKFVCPEENTEEKKKEEERKENQRQMQKEKDAEKKKQNTIKGKTSFRYD